MPAASKSVKKVQAEVQALHANGKKLLLQLEQQVQKINEMAEKHLEDGLLGQYAEALAMRDEAAASLLQLQDQFGYEPSQSQRVQVQSDQVANFTSQTLAALACLHDANAQQTWSTIALSEHNQGSKEGAKVGHSLKLPSYRWQLHCSGHDSVDLQVDSCLGDVGVFEIYITDAAVQVVCESRNWNLRLPIGFQTDPSACCVVRRRNGKVLRITIPWSSPAQDPVPAVVRGLCSAEGFAVVDGFMGGLDADAVRNYLLARWRAGDFTPGEIEGGEDKQGAVPKRSDTHMYAEYDDPNLKPFLRRLDRLVLQVVQGAPELQQLKLMRGRAMTACYVGKGARYVPHFDAVCNDNGRILTCILYLNPFWQNSDGAQLRLWPHTRTIGREGLSYDISPLHGRLVVFLCNSRNLHEVRPVSEPHVEPRLAISCWYYDTDRLSREAAERPQDAPCL